MKESKFKIFLDKAKGVLPGLGNVVGKLATGNYIGAIADVGGILTGKARESTEEGRKAKELLVEFELQKMDFALEEQKLELENLNRATSLYKEDSLTQKILSMTFLVLYVILSLLVLYGFYKGAIDKVIYPNSAVGFAMSLHGGMSMKVNTIIDFFFGSSSADKTGSIKI
mgnify:CR=1 FL=1|tara:strand:+ start:1597 stop:2106 length:510 start_codon:yes stop_codon:yes gene_type:complete